MKVELYYFDGCPSRQAALQNVKQALAAENLPDSVELVAVGSEADVQMMRFLGSPTIRINGIDAEGGAAEEHGYGYGCRVYTEAGASRGWPSVDLLRRALRRAHEA